MLGKSTYRNISETSKLLGVPTHVLRFWETQFSQIKPVQRVGGRRYYREEDIALISRIKDYLYKEHYTIKGVQKILKVSVDKTETKGEGVDAFVEEIQNIKKFLGDVLVS